MSCCLESIGGGGGVPSVELATSCGRALPCEPGAVNLRDASAALDIRARVAKPAVAELRRLQKPALRARGLWRGGHQHWHREGWQSGQWNPVADMHVLLLPTEGGSLRLQPIVIPACALHAQPRAWLVALELGCSRLQPLPKREGVSELRRNRERGSSASELSSARVELISDHQLSCSSSR